ncbi:MAG: hypothetical protein EXQ56_07595 [Acidobacteria bacterium]|nr:hypothetical protein [Acidobacteriota bacterium]
MPGTPMDYPQRWPGDSEHDLWSEVRGGRLAPDASAASPAGAPTHESDEDDHWLGRIALVYIAHPTIPNLFHFCFDYAEPWDWSRETEHVPTGCWVRRD